MDERPIKTIMTHYQPIFLTLFEYYLKQSYQTEKNPKVFSSCLGVSSLQEFCSEFALSPRLNKTSLEDLLHQVIGKEALEDRYEPVVIVKPVFTLLATTKQKPPVPVEKRLITFFDFQQIIYCIS
jgi:hypothetical protein